MKIFVLVSEQEAESINHNSEMAHKKGWFSSPQGWLKEVVIDMAALEQKFKIECTDGTDFYKVKMVLPPSQLFKWFKKQIEGNER